MEDMKRLNKAGAITDSFMDKLKKDGGKAAADNAQAEFIKDRSGHFGRKYRRHRRDNKYYA